MGQPVIQTSWNAGEWAPALNARVDMAKYHSGAALLRNFFVDYRGGATTRPGSRYILPTKSLGARLIPFQASFTVSYLLEFGDEYIRFYNNGAPILETATTITSQSGGGGSPIVFTDAGHGYSNGDWLFIADVYYIVQNSTANTFTLTDLFGNSINTTPFIDPQSAQRIYEISSPYLISEVFGIKYAQDVNLLFMCHPNHSPQVLTLNSATDWTINAIQFAPTIASVTGLSAGNNASTGSDALSYVVTAVDVNGQESLPIAVTVSSLALINTSWTTTITWTAVAGAVSYNAYKTVINTNNSIPTGLQYGFIGNCTGVTFLDTNIVADFSQSPPLLQNPFSGSGVATLTLTAQGNNFTTVPSVSIGAPPGGGIQAVANCILTGINVNTVATGSAYSVGDTIFSDQGGLIFVVTGTSGTTVTSFNVVTHGSIASGSVPGNPITTHVNGPGGRGFEVDVTWGIGGLVLTNPGSGYITVPAVSFVGGGGSGASATATLGAASSGNPTVPGFVQQRSVFGGPVLSPSQLNFSQPGSPFNFNVTNPTQDDDAIQETFTNTTLNSIKSMVGVAAGLLVFTDKGAWVVNGGANGAAIGATTITANPQNYSGSSDLPPILTQQDLLYVQSKGSIVRDLAFNFYLSTYVGNDISILSSHLFYGFNLIQWAWAEEPFKVVWAVRNDGVLLSLSFVKEQELIAWTHHDTLGSYTSVATITESTTIGNVDAIYVIAQRSIQGQTVQYIERFVELTYPNDYKSSWQVDAGIGYNGSPETTFSGAQHLGGQVVTGVADGVVINFTMPTSGTFVFGPGGTPGLTAIPSASIVTVGLAFLPQIKTLQLDLGEPTVQGKRKKISAVTVRARQALGISIGATFNTLTPMKDFVIGNVGTMSNALVTGLVTDDGRTIIDPNWTVQGQFCIQQNNPYPASVLGIIPEIDVGDTPK